jgi:hypothetical protein
MPQEPPSRVERRLWAILAGNEGTVTPAGWNNTTIGHMVCDELRSLVFGANDTAVGAARHQSLFERKRPRQPAIAGALYA